MQSAPSMRQKWNKNNTSKILTSQEVHLRHYYAHMHANSTPTKKTAAIHQEPFVGNSINRHKYIFNYLQQQTMVIINWKKAVLTAMR